ncbi:hypothetical protein GCM10010441_12270 [Kitasatospora paracochleata]|uniref:DUF11 domain-containing protein n=2 Tax=Kitasatospora paracochleata TaxID=58354 RepID=A0ABT1IU86_9ACTN|nr:hypothetical protein [Kitasatospora paracochleata]MCP2308503.1 hypothetical protein [Kitasatospora paracochleata]
MRVMRQWAATVAAAGAAVAVAAAGAAVAVAGAPVAAAPMPRADLAVVRLDPDPVAPGGLTTVHGFVANHGPDRTAAPFTVLIDLPAGFTAEGPYFPADCVAAAGGHLVRCAFGAGLPAQRTATALVPVRSDADVPPGTVAEGHVRVVSAEDADPSDDGTAFTLSVR